LVYGVGFNGLGYAGLALSLSLVSTFNAVLLVAFIRPRIGGINGSVVAVSLIKILGATAVMGGVVYALTAASHAWMSSIRSARIADVVFGVPAGALAFYAAASALRIAEIAEAREALLRKFRKSVC
jgi:peptidoglycan biosynthesis protein MviN/MurJ (putative lipid II flippase)